MPNNSYRMKATGEMQTLTDEEYGRRQAEFYAAGAVVKAATPPVIVPAPALKPAPAAAMPMPEPKPTKPATKWPQAKHKR